MLCPIHPEGWRFVGIFAFIALLLAQLHPALGAVGFVLAMWCIYFFRNPQRVTPERLGCLVSPADGRIVAISDQLPAPELGLSESVHTRISIFLNVFDVHVNRLPTSGMIKKVFYHPGKFFNASLDKASEHNERNTLIIETPEGLLIGCVQIAGLIARRIRCDVKEGDQVKRGQVYGLIRFGSRMDIYIPKDADILVLKGQRVIAGETLLAQFFQKNNEE